MFVFSNLATSLDGKIATAGREHFYLGTPADRDRMQVLRRRADAILMGASTLRTFQRPCVLRGTPRHQPANVILSRNLAGIDPEWPFFTRNIPGFRRILLVTGEAPARRLARFEASCEVIPLHPKKPAAPQAVATLAALGIERLLVEGGG